MDEKVNSRFPLLAPLFFCSIVPIIYLTLSVLGMSVATANPTLPYENVVQKHVGDAEYVGVRVYH